MWQNCKYCGEVKDTGGNCSCPKKPVIVPSKPERKQQIVWDFINFLSQNNLFIPQDLIDKYFEK